MTSILVEIPGTPVPKARPRFGNGRAYTPRKTRAWEHQIGWYAKLAMGGLPPILGPVSVTITAYLPVPKALKVVNSRHIKKPDLDNLTKAALDACNGIVWADDSQVYHIVASKVYDDKPRLIIYITQG